MNDDLKPTPMRQYTGVYFSFFGAARKLKTGKARLKYYDGLFNYLFYGIEPDFSLEDLKTAAESAQEQAAYEHDADLLETAWSFVKLNADAVNNKIENGSKGDGLKRQEPKV